MTEDVASAGPAGVVESAALVRVSRQDAVAVVTLSRPGVLNALNGAVRESLWQELDEVSRAADINAVIIEGEGRCFCAGQDQRESASFQSAEAAAVRIDQYYRIFHAIQTMRQPVIAKIRGYAAGAGLELAVACDLRIADDQAKLGLTELEVGSASILGSAMVMGLTSIGVAKRLSLGSDFLTAVEAQRLGLVDDVVAADGLDQRVWETATRLGTYSAFAVNRTKRWTNRALVDALDHALSAAHGFHAENFAQGTMTKGAEEFLGRRSRSE